MSDETKKDDAGCCGSDAGGPSGNLNETFPLPKVTFSTFIMSLGSSALVHLGEVPEPETGQPHPDLILAKHTIDILSMLQSKTEKCLDEDERRLLEGLLYDLRMKYVLKSK